MVLQQTLTFFLLADSTLKRTRHAMDDIRIEKIVRSRRRTIALIITPDARLIVRAPLRGRFPP